MTITRINKDLLKTILLLALFSISTNCKSQNIAQNKNQDSLTSPKKRQAIVIEGLGKTWGATLSYEYRIHKNISCGIGCGTTPVFSGGEFVGVGYGILHLGKAKSHFVASAGLMFSNVITSPNLGFGYELETNRFYFRALPYAIMNMDNDYPILPSVGLYFGVKI